MNILRKLNGALLLMLSGAILTTTITSCKKSDSGGGGNTSTKPTITSFTPQRAVSGTVVTITGTNLTGATAVKFGGTAAASFNVVSATSITAVVGTGASGAVSVTTPNGTGEKTGFTYLVPDPNNLYAKISGASDLSKIKAGIDKGKLQSVLQNPDVQYTVFAPTNASIPASIDFATFSQETNDAVIRYHTLATKYVPGAADVTNFKVFTANQPQDSLFITKISVVPGFFVNGKQYVGSVATNKIDASNGNIYKINGILVPPVSNVYDYVTDPTISTGIDSLSKVIKRVEAAYPEVKALLQSSIVTVFAPSNEAFAQLIQALGTGNPTIKQINDVPAATLYNVLKGHVIVGRTFFINALIASQTGAPGTPTLTPSAPLKVTSNYDAFIGQGASANISREDITCFNGVVHKISGILLP